MLLSLPTSLLALLFASPILSAPTTPNDLFHAVAVHAPRQPEEPVCCLRPLPPIEAPVEDDLLLSFEDWKAKRLSESPEREPVPPLAHKSTENASHAPAPDAAPHTSDAQGSVSPEAQENGGVQERTAPHFRIPIHDRFNYASLDCTARVHAAHKSAKSPSSVLSSKKDRYMLSPCAEKTQFIIVELCEDIRIDTVQLANYEFFSGVFKDFTVSVSKTYYPNDPESWTFAGTFRAKNVRGVQSFHPPPTLRDFYRYIRIDFHSHYGNEYYCPVSLLRVYGLTHLEEWQWETWEAESRAKRSVEEASTPVEVVAEPPKPVHIPAVEPQVVNDDKSGGSPVLSDGAVSQGYSTDPLPDLTLESLTALYEAPPPTSHGVDETPKSGSAVGAIHELYAETLSSSPKIYTESMSHEQSRPSDTVYNIKTAPAHSSSVLVSSSSSSITSSSSSPQFNPHIVTSALDNHSSLFIYHPSDSGSTHSSPVTTSARASVASPNISSLSVVSPSYSHPPAPPASTGGESIYRLIMNRLTALEANTTLYARYVEEQTAGMREVLRRLSEDIGRLESIGKAQSQLYQRSVGELEKQTRRLEHERRELVSRVNHLADEVVLEKRLGIAQLCLLLTVLVFMALTRGSRGDAVYPARHSVRDWGRRTLSISGDWMDRLRTRSATPPLPSLAPQKPGENEVTFPSLNTRATSSLDVQVAERLSRSSRRGPGAGGARKQSARPHTPTSIRTPTSRHLVHHRAVPSSPSFHLPRPTIQRSSSGSMTLGFGGVGPVPKSARRWARSAHLHEVKGAAASSPSADRIRHRTSAADDGQETPLASTSTTASTDVFGPQHPDTVPTLLMPAFDGAGTISKGKARAVGIQFRHPSPLRDAPVVDLASPPAVPPYGRETMRRASTTNSETSEGDGWVDTDVDGSECDLVVDAAAGAEPGIMRERTYVPGVAGNSSL
ncbi:UNC-like C-terminal-domain-containing protein [Trametes elegans]|nr:UNC-like C-terminal-domain-containing protein [Trametes elegans]